MFLILVVFGENIGDGTKLSDWTDVTTRMTMMIMTTVDGCRAEQAAVKRRARGAINNMTLVTLLAERTIAFSEEVVGTTNAKTDVALKGELKVGGLLTTFIARRGALGVVVFVIIIVVVADWIGHIFFF